MKPPPRPPSTPPSPIHEMKPLRNTVHRLLTPRRPPEEPPRLEDRPPHDDERMPDRPRTLASRVRPSPSSSRGTESPEDDDDYNTEPSSSSSSSAPSRRSGEPNSSSSSASRSASSARDLSHIRFNVERRRANVTEHAREAAQLLANSLDTVDDHTAERAVRDVGEFAFASADPVALLERQDALDEVAALHKLVEVVAAFLQDVGVVTLGLSIFGGLRIDEGIGLRVGMMRTVEVVVTALQMYQGDALVVREGLRALCGLTRLDDVRTRILSRCGAIEIAVECLQRHVEDESVQNEGAKFISFASLHSETNKTELARGGGLSRVLSAAREFRESGTLCTHVCIGLRNVTVSRPDIVEIALGLDGVNGVLEILRAHGGGYTTATHALAGLYHITGGDSGIREVLRHDGWEMLLVESGRRHTGRADVQALSLAVMGRVAGVGGALAARRLVRCGAVKMALAGMHRFVNRRAVMYFGARLVRVLLESGGGMEDVRACGGVDKLLDLLYCTVVTAGSGEERYSGYADIFADS